MSERDFGGEWRLVPAWARSLAVVAFIAVLALMRWAFLHEPNPPPLALQLAFGCLIGALMATVVLLTGYVNGDARRRGMSATAWTFAVALVPNAIGFVVYFLCRRPLRAPCPGCGCLVRTGANYCPKCGLAQRSVCGRCGRAREGGDRYCAHCGQAAGEAGSASVSALPGPSIA